MQREASPISKQRWSGTGLAEALLRCQLHLCLNIMFWLHASPLWPSQSVHRPVQQWPVPVHAQRHCQDRTNWWVVTDKERQLGRRSPGEDSWEGAQRSMGAGRSQYFGRKPRDASSLVVSNGPWASSLAFGMSDCQLFLVSRLMMSLILPTLLCSLLLVRASDRLWSRSWGKCQV